MLPTRKSVLVMAWTFPGAAPNGSVLHERWAPADDLILFESLDLGVSQAQFVAQDLMIVLAQGGGRPGAGWPPSPSCVFPLVSSLYALPVA